jgi:hypothetical protein
VLASVYDDFLYVWAVFFEGSGYYGCLYELGAGADDGYYFHDQVCPYQVSLTRRR